MNRDEFEIYFVNRYINTACPLNRPFSGFFLQKIICFVVMRRMASNNGLSFIIL